ncbi:MAG TPA: acyl-CoA dehydrogenase family protein, partial [Rhodoblastus sp.]|nr:acyl-CoA dehydrogenase family protein [Rhodoblastus sp.]
MTDAEREHALNDLRMSDKACPLFDAVKRHIAENVAPIMEEFEELDREKEDRWSWHPRQLELLDGAKKKAKAAGLWNFFLPNAETGEGLSNLDYAYIAAELGKQPLASETLNCSAPDTGNMEVLERVGTAEQKKTWLEPLLNGEIRSAYAMTEPNVASSDAKNISTTAVLDGNGHERRQSPRGIAGDGQVVEGVPHQIEPARSVLHHQNRRRTTIDIGGRHVHEDLPLLTYWLRAIERLVVAPDYVAIGAG